MKVLFLCTSDFAGGAAISSYRLFQGLKGRGLDLAMEVQQKIGLDPAVRRAGPAISSLFELGRRPLEGAWLKRFYPKANSSNFMAARLPDDLASRIRRFAPDLIHVHWVGHGFLRPETLRGMTCPIVWTLHDMWMLTGGCYYDGGCGRYAERCGRCPVLGSARERDLSRKVWERKERAWRELNLTAVCPSRWLTGCARASPLLRDRRVETIPYGLDLDRFKPWPKPLARQMLGLPAQAPLLLFGAAGLSGTRKGFHLLCQALRSLSETRGDVELVVYGGDPPAQAMANINTRWHGLGVLRDEITAALAYSAADVFVAPSMEDNLPNTVIEAAACGLPVVAFRVGGLPDIVDHRHTGLLATPFDVPELTAHIKSLLESHDVRVEIGRAAREKALRDYGSRLQGDRYEQLYAELSVAGRKRGVPVR